MSLLLDLKFGCLVAQIRSISKSDLLFEAKISKSVDLKRLSLL